MDGVFQNAIGGYIATQIAQWQVWAVSLVPDWLLFLLAVPAPVWWLVSIVLSYCLGRWGWGGVLAVLTIGISAFIAARLSLRKEPDEPPSHPVAPIPATRPERKPLFPNLFRRKC